MRLRLRPVRRLALALLSLVAALAISGAAAASGALPTSTELSKYLIIGMQNSGDGDAIDVNSSNELGANQQFLSTSDPNTKSVFASRWTSAGSPNGNTTPPPPAAVVMTGIDYSGNLAVTGSSGDFTLSDIDVYATIGVHCETTPCDNSVSNTDWFDGNAPDPQSMPGSGITAFNATPLLDELSAWKTFIAGLGTAELTITSDIKDTGSSPRVDNLNTIDANNDGIALIDINTGGDFEVNNADWILQGDANVIAIIRVVGGANFKISNGSILLGNGGIGGGSTTQPVSSLGAIIVKLQDGGDSSDQVFNLSNFVLNGVGIWDLVDIGENNGSNTTEINGNNGQGCAQFISQAVVFNDMRWKRCAPPAPPATNPAIDIRKQIEGSDSREFGSGSNVDFEIVVTNTGNVNLMTVTVTDPLVGDCAKSIGTLTPGQSDTYSCTDTNVTSGYTNVATVTGSPLTGPNVTDNDPSTVTITPPNPAIDIRKQAEGTDSREFGSGSNVDFEVVVTNTGDVTLTNVTVMDPAVGDCAKVIGTLNPSESATYTCTATNVVADFTNIATVTGDPPTGDQVTDNDPSTVTIIPPNPAIDIRKQAEGPDSRDVIAGSDVVFNIVVTNTGDVTLTDVTVTDVEVGDCAASLGTLNPGQSSSYTCTDTNVTSGYENIAAVRGTPPTGPNVTDQDPSTVTVSPADPAIDIRKQAEGTDSREVGSGSNVDFEIVITNTGNVPLTNITVTDPLATDCARAIATLPDLDPGASTSYTCTAFAVTSEFTNVATVTGDPPTGEKVTDDDPSTVTIALVATPEIDIRKQAEGDDSRDIIGGSDVEFLIVVTNTGNVTLTDVEVSDPLATDCNKSIGTLNPGGSDTYTCTASNVTATFNNIATVTGNPPTGDEVSDNDPSEIAVTPPNPAIDIRKQAEGFDTRAFLVGEPVEFEIEVTNIGNVTLTDVTVTDPLVPDCARLSGTLPDLDPGESTSYTCAIASGAATSLTNIASVEGTAPDGTTVGDDDPSTITVSEVPDPKIDIRKQAEGADTRAFLVGEPVEFVIEVTNTGNVTLTDVEVSDPLVPGCVATLGTLLVGETVSYTCAIAGGAATSFTNIATVTANPPTANPVTDEDPSEITVSDPPKCEPSKKGKPPVCDPPKKTDPPKCTPPKKGKPPVCDPPKKTDPPKCAAPKKGKPPACDPPKKTDPPKADPPKMDPPKSTGSSSGDKGIIVIDFNAGGPICVPGLAAIKHEQIGGKNRLWKLVGKKGAKTRFFKSGRRYGKVYRSKGTGNGYFVFARAYILAKVNMMNGVPTTPEVERSLRFAEQYFAKAKPRSMNIKRALRGKTLKAKRRKLRALKARARTLRHHRAVLVTYNNGDTVPICTGS